VIFLNFTIYEYIATTQQSVETIKHFRNQCNDLYLSIKAIPDCREKSIAITKLEEVSMITARILEHMIHNSPEMFI